MQSSFSVVCLAVLVGMATSCCLPDQGSFDFAVQLTTNVTYGGRSKSDNQSFGGSGSFDFTKQKFYLYVSGTDSKSTTFLDLSKKKGIATTKWEDKFTRCSATLWSGKAGKPWQCVLDNDKIFVGREKFNINLEGNLDYYLNLPPMFMGPLTLKNGTCFPITADVDYVIDVSYFKMSMNFHVEFTKIVEEVADEGVFKPPCEADEPEGRASEVPTPDQLVQILRESVTQDSGPVSEPQAEPSP